MSDGAEPFFVSKDKGNIELSLSQQLIGVISDQQGLSISEILEKFSRLRRSTKFLQMMSR